MFEQPSEHVMAIESTLDSGAEVWSCPECGRRLLIQWMPAFDWMVLESGDQNAAHSGAKGGITVNRLDKYSTPEVMEKELEYVDFDEARLAPWEEWMTKVDFERLWDD